MENGIAKSPGRNRFQQIKYEAKLIENPADKLAQRMLELFEDVYVETEKREASDDWKIDNLEYDLRTSKYIVDKARADKAYAQHIYAALCNNEFQRNSVWPILTDKRWSCSWRYAGGIVADIMGEGDYIDWYCSGIRGDEGVPDGEFQTWTAAQQEEYLEWKRSVPESTITEEVRQDLFDLGWVQVDSTDKF
jgi:hypothetical protein